MHIVLGALALLGTIIFIWYRLKDTRQIGGEALEAADDLRATVRRLMYKHKHDAHPADSVDDPRLAASGIAVAVATMDGPITQAEIETLARLSGEIFEVSGREALDIVSFGRWVAGQCTTNMEAVRRLSRIIARRAGAEAGPDLLRLVTEVATASGNQIGEDEEEALFMVRRTLGMT